MKFVQLTEGQHSLVIGNVTVRAKVMSNDKVRLVFDAPPEVIIMRSELVPVKKCDMCGSRVCDGGQSTAESVLCVPCLERE